ncbi:SusD/RagB family nutrient-binding outer membrane lipoprotein [Danxiaibacter flavus]|uniref:SusD/RagB family nutrient-binding outer membrane lipoprotein n=1 Tax=Danxiaibacter flavus TaxID=3049108 RepID=A0ABV3ZAT8_9BACT|nr:SusD/RagB family nutrient-binding outer membrane lipoprotein [Chitinophagaceae bacterium DXS]
MKRTTIYIAFAVSGMILGSCSKDFEAINTDPEHLTNANMNYNYLLTAAQLTTSGNSDANAYEDWRNNLIYASCMIQHLSSTFGYWGGDKYTYNAGYNSAYWDQTFNNPVRNIIEVIENSKNDTAHQDLYQIARIFKVFMFQRVTDMYGDCPYSEAGRGYTNGITSPKYDKQQDIYADMLKELQEAAGALGSGANTVGSADILYSGDPVQWKKFAYSEMLRLAMRMVKVDPDNAKKWAQTAVTGGVMTSITDDAVFSHQTGVPGTATTNGSALVLDGVDPNAARLSATFVNYLVATKDPRLIYFGTVAEDPNNTDDLGDNSPAIQLGQPNGYDNAGGAFDITKAPGYPGSQAKYSIVNRNTFARLDAPTFFLTYAETALLQAEAVQRGWISGSVSDFYTRGVTAAMNQLGQIAKYVNATPAPLPAISAADITAYLQTNPFNAGDALNQINTQYWIATFMDEYEAWANWRRTGFPHLNEIKNYPTNVTNGSIPRRFTYPLSEATTNTDNYNAAVAGLSNGDKMTSRVWWDK